MKQLRCGRLPAYLFALIWGVVTFIPLVVTLLCSFKDNAGIMLGMFNWPTQFRWRNYLEALTVATMGRAVLNSIFIAALSTIVVTLLGMLASYILARKQMKALPLVYALFIVGVMVPVHCTIIPISSMATVMQGRNTYWYLVLVYSAFNISQAVFLFTGYIKGISRELDEAAILDGCCDTQILFKILFPVSIPIITTEAILSFIYGYGELLFAMSIITREQMYTVSRAMLAFQGGHQVNLGPIFACIVIAVLPMIVIYLLFHEKVQSGMLTGAVKG